jgi:hypothetical protein
MNYFIFSADQRDTGQTAVSFFLRSSTARQSSLRRWYSRNISIIAAILAISAMQFADQRPPQHVCHQARAAYP